MKPVIYIAGKFRATKQPHDRYEEHQNVIASEREAHYVWSIGGAAISPHLNTAHYQNSLPDDTWLSGDLAIMLKCDAVYAIPKWRESVGATEEIRVAKENNIPVLYTQQEVYNYVLSFAKKSNA